MSLITYRVIPNSYVYGFSRMDDEVAEACVICTKKAHELGIDLEFKVGGGGYHFEVASGVVFVNGQHYRGRLQGRRITIHSGWDHIRRRYGTKPVFSSIEAFARLLWHETEHAWSGHTSDGNCLMHPHAANWPCPGEVARLKQRFGAYTPPSPPEPEPTPVEPGELERLKELAVQLAQKRNYHWREYDRLKTEVRELNEKIQELERAQLRGNFSLAADVGECCCPFEIGDR